MCFFRYRLARNKAFKLENIESGFRRAGLCPLLTADAWLEAYGEEHNIEMKTTMFDLMQKRHKQVQQFPPTPSINSLDLAIYEPKERNVLPTPSVHSKKKKKPRLSIIGEKFCEAKILNLPSRRKRLTDEELRRKAAHEAIRERRRKTAVRRELKKKVSCHLLSTPKFHVDKYVLSSQIMVVHSVAYFKKVL